MNKDLEKKLFDKFDFFHKAIIKSMETCEVCGKKGSLCRRGSWLKTLCKKCAKENGYE